jgi:GNAT superfamily N-acetyltransferase
VLIDSSKQDAFRDVLIREIIAADAAAAAELSGELGYPVAPDVMKQRIEFLSGLADHVIYVACLSEKVVGWIDIGVSHHLHAEPRAEIGGLVVSSEARGRGIGRLLVAHVEEWARQHGLTSMLVRSQIKREDAHRFYLREGYARTKTSVVFTKELG